MIETTKMTMIEYGDGKIKWECGKCKELIKDKKGFEIKVTNCPKCNAKIEQFIGLFDEYGNYT